MTTQPNQPDAQAHDAPQTESQIDQPIDAQADATSGPHAGRGADVPVKHQQAPDLSDDVQAEIDAAMAQMDAEDAAAAKPKGDKAAKADHAHPHDVAPAGGAAKPKLRGPRVVEGGREHRVGVVVSVGSTDIFIEFGPKEIGVVELSQYPPGEGPKVGEQLEVIVQRYEASESIYICARPGAVQKADWELLEPGQVVEARVTGTNKGGLACEVAGHDAFIPASQVDVDRVPDLSVFVGEKLPCVVQRIDRRGKGNIVLSRRELLAQERAKAAEGLKEALKEGDEIEGVVRRIADFGAFVDLGGIDGLIHLSDLAHERINHGAKSVSRHVSEGQKVRVKILKLDWDAGRIGLGLKQMQADPFDAAATDIVEGAIVSGKVTKILEFGCFVEVAPGLEGLVHISEIDYRRIAKVEDAVQENEVVQVKVLKVDQQSRKISLSIKQTKEGPQRSGGGGGRGGRGGRDDRTPEEIKKETPELRRMREKAKQREKEERKRAGGGGLGNAGSLGLGLGDLKL
ncbi:MAG: S1 RNA-binding domain-containing protein [Planctomycetota bacterium]